MRELGERLRRYLILGLVVIAPLGVTVLVLRWLFERIDVIIGRYLPPIAGTRWPGLGILALVVLLLLVGWVSDRTVGRRVLDRWNYLLSRVPLVRRIYGASSRVVQSVLDRQENLFRYCALIEYPEPGAWALAFATARAPAEVEEEIGARAVSLFLPTAPNPTSGYLVILPEERVRRLEMTVEEGFRMILSAGAAVPDEDAPHGVQLAGEPGAAPPAAESRPAEMGDLAEESPAAPADRTTEENAGAGSGGRGEEGPSEGGERRGETE